jgi:hypothetical protein
MKGSLLEGGCEKNTKTLRPVERFSGIAHSGKRSDPETSGSLYRFIGQHKPKDMVNVFLGRDIRNNTTTGPDIGSF